MKLILLFCLILTVSTAQSSFIRGDGRFESKEGDSLTFIKKQLIHNALKKIVTKQIKDIGLDPELFWDKYNTSLEQHLEGIKERLETKYKVGDPKQTRAQKDAFRKKWRARRLVATQRFGNLNKAMRSFSIKRMSRSSQYPALRYMTIEARLNNKVLKNIYFRFVSEKSFYKIPQLYVSVGLSSNGVDWTRFGVESKEAYLKALRQHISRWLNDNLKLKVDNIVISDPSLDERLKASQRMSDQALTLQAEQEETSEFIDAFWLKINLNLKVDNEIEELKKRMIATEGSVALWNLRANKLVYVSGIEKTMNSYQYSDPQFYSSAIASHLYQRSVKSLLEIKKSIDGLDRNRKTAIISVTGISSVEDVFNFNAQVQDSGIALQVNTKIHYYGPDRAEIELTYRGSDDQLRQILLSLGNNTLKNDRMIVIPDAGNPLQLGLQDAGERKIKNEI